MEIDMEKNLIKLDISSKQIHIYGGQIKKVSQDKLGRVHITLK